MNPFPNIRRTVVSLASTTSVIDVTLNAVLLNCVKMEVQSIGVPTITGTVPPILYVTAANGSPLTNSASALINGLGVVVPSNSLFALPNPSATVATTYIGSQYQFVKTYDNGISIQRIQLSLLNPDGTAANLSATTSWSVQLIFYCVN